MRVVIAAVAVSLTACGDGNNYPVYLKCTVESGKGSTPREMLVRVSPPEMMVSLDGGREFKALCSNEERCFVSANDDRFKVESRDVQYTENDEDHRLDAHTIDRVTGAYLHEHTGEMLTGGRLPFVTYLETRETGQCEKTDAPKQQF